MRFDWDERKAAANRAKHGIAFAEATTAFDDPFALVAPTTCTRHRKKNGDS